MATLTGMIDICKGSTEKAEEVARDFIAKGNHSEWLNLGLLLASQGRFKESRKCGEEYAKYFPNCPRLRFGMGYYKLMDGDFQDGMKDIYLGGRGCNNFGSPPPPVGKPMWDGKSDIKGKKILFHGEGGFGDEIINVRFSKYLADRGANTIVSASETLLSVFSRVDGVSAVVDKRFLGTLYYDYWIPGMASPWICGCDYTNLLGHKYIPDSPNDIWEKLFPKVDGKINIGIRWAGLPTFEHEQFRTYPVQPLLKALNNSKINAFSFQRDANMIELPSHVTDVSSLIKTWEDTAGIMKQMDLIISSCTSTAHMSAALGRPTWIILPIMSYYTWALPGDTSPWYDSVKLFRQEKFGEWDSVLEKVIAELNRKVC